MSTNQSNQLNKFEDFRTRYMASQFSCLLACLLCACFSALTQLRQRIAARHRRQLLSRIAACNLHSRNTQTGHRPPLSSLMQQHFANLFHPFLQTSFVTKLSSRIYVQLILRCAFSIACPPAQLYIFIILCCIKPHHNKYCHCMHIQVRVCVYYTYSMEFFA